MLLESIFFLAFSLSLFITGGLAERDTLGQVQSAPAQSVPAPRSSCHPLAADCWRGESATQSCRVAEAPWGHAITTLKGNLTPADGTSALLPFSGYRHAQAKVVLHVPFPFPFFIFFKWGHQLLPSSLTRPALHRRWCGRGNWRRDRWQSWKKTQRALGLPIYSGQFRACHLNIHSW